MQTLFAALLAAVLAFVVHTGPTVARRQPQATFSDVKRLIQEHYVRPVDEQELTWAALRGMVQALDPYSAFLTPAEARSFLDETEGEFGGLGIEITVEDGLVLVIAPLEGTPAFEAGMLPGDRIIAIEGEAREFRSAEEAARVLKGPPGTRVRLTVVHPGESRPVEIEITRAVIHVPSVRRPELLEPQAGIGYVRVAQFGPEAGKEVRAAVERLRADGMRALVLDLRSNPGGHLEAALEVADLFIREGVLLRTEGREGARSYPARAEGTIADLPLVVLINGYSASASEIVAGALKDAGRAHLIGTRTFGKGSVQQLIELGPREAPALLRLTTALFYTASGRPIHRQPGAGPEQPWGIEPHEMVELDAATLQRIYRAQAANGYPARAPAAAPAGEQLAPSRPPLPEPRDTQLEAALRYLRGRLMEMNPAPAPAAAGAGS